MVVVQVRAFAEWPGAKAKFDIGSPDGEMKTLDLKIITTRVGNKGGGSDGVVKLVGDALVVPCGDNTTLEILELQPPGKKVMRAKDFCNGLRGQQILVSYSKQLSI
jgi:methionyl-tRNA formyltransferase